MYGINLKREPPMTTYIPALGHSILTPLYDSMMKWLARESEFKPKLITQAKIQTSSRVLDLGCGPGTMSRILLDTVDDVSELVLMDPLRQMLSAAKSRFSGDSAQMTSGIFEHLPFRDDTFDVVMCGFSFRDAQNYREAIEEIGRILKRGEGRLLIVDLGKPDSRLRRWLVGTYFRFIAGFLTFLILGRKGLVFSSIYPTYRKYPKVSRTRSLLEAQFGEVTIETRMLGGAMIAIARQPNKV